MPRGGPRRPRPPTVAGRRKRGCRRSPRPALLRPPREEEHPPARRATDTERVAVMIDKLEAAGDGDLAALAEAAAEWAPKIPACLDYFGRIEEVVSMEREIRSGP